MVISFGNIIVLLTSSSPGTPSSYWNGGGCEPVTFTNNTMNTDAYNLLNPIDKTHPAPPIPPIPKQCVVKSPYTTNTGTPC